MNELQTKELLERVSLGAVSVEDAVLALKQEPFSDLGFAKVDHHRALRQGAAEVIYGAGKTVDQMYEICKSMISAGQETILITRLDTEQALELQTLLFGVGKDGSALVENPDNFTYYELPRIALVGSMPQNTGMGSIVVAAAGTSDLPVAEEAALTAEALGNNVVRLYDVGVAGIHRLLAHTEELMSAQVVIAVAGMEGALASVVGGLTSAPVIAVPTSVGYGASFGGVAALLSMLNSCASGVSVVNIDNGFGAGFQASLINHLPGKAYEHDHGHGHEHGHHYHGHAHEHENQGCGCGGHHYHHHHETHEHSHEVHDHNGYHHRHHGSDHHNHEQKDIFAQNPEPITATHYKPAGQGADIVLKLDVDATRSSILDQLVALMNDQQKQAFRVLIEGAKVPDYHHHSMANIRTTINELAVPCPVRLAVREVYELLAQAEASVHGVSVDQAHFHEVGRAAGIRNTLAICSAFYVLDPISVRSTKVQTGKGTIECAHGTLSIPAPATKAILNTGIPTIEEALLSKGELCTPTSAAIIAYFVSDFDA